jgi:tetratricopeptide (TPR) repeat protein
MCPTAYKQNVDILVAYLGTLRFPLIENKSAITRNIKFFKNENSCISKLSSTKGRVMYFIISATLAKKIIPLIHNETCIEHIYIQKDDNIPQNFALMDGYSKIRGMWSSIEEIMEQAERDIFLMETHPSRWSRTADIFGQLWAQTSSTSIVPDIADDIKRTYEAPIIVTLSNIRPAPFNLFKSDIISYEFSIIEDCYQFINKHGKSSIFLIIIGEDNNVIIDEVQLLVKYDSIHALYVFPINDDSDKQDATISVCEHPKVSGIFYQEKDLLLQIVADICFFRQIPTHIPTMSMLKIEFDLLSTLNEDKKAFLSFQFFIDVLQQLWCAPGVPSDISDCIEKSSTDSSSDLYMNNIQFTLAINRLIKQLDPVTLIKASSHLRLINQHFESSIQKRYPFSITVYHAQLVSDKELQAIQNNNNSLLGIHTFVLASRSCSSIKSICRRAWDNGLIALLMEINIPKTVSLNYLDSDIIIFPLSTVFKIKSTAIAPDQIWHVQMELADSTMDLIKAQLYHTIGEHLTWLTFGNYLSHIEHFDTAEKYFKYLQDTIPPKSRESASIYNNMSLMYLSMNDKDQEAFSCLKKAEELIKLDKAKVSENRTEYTKEHSDNNKQASQYEKLAELYEQQGDDMSACFFYEKALQCTIEPTLRKIFQLKIETLNAKN